MSETDQDPIRKPKSASAKRKAKRYPAPQNARELALEALLQVYEDLAYSNISLDQLLKKYPLSAEEKRFATALFYGTLSETPALDEMISRYSKRPLAKLDPAVLAILRMALWQIYFSVTPESAAVNEAVTLCRLRGYGSASGLVNAILRSALREEAVFTPKSLEAASALPEALAQAMLTWLGSEEEVIALGKALRENEGLSVRVRQGSLPEVQELLKKDGVEILPSAFQVNAMRLKTGGRSLPSLEAWQKGLIIAQGEGAMLPALALAPQKGEVIADLCAAPGGKSLQLADLLGEEGLVLASDQSAKRMGLLEKTALRLGLTNLECQVADASELPVWPFTRGADKILVDVPCSGLGLLASKPELKFRFDPEQVRETLIPVQKKILARASAYLPAGGYLVYSTCTVNPEENEGVVDDFLQEHTNYQLVSLRGRLPEEVEKNLLAKDPSLEAALARGRITLWPHKVKSEGFFVALLKKE